jgi:hypothetical protein
MGLDMRAWEKAAIRDLDDIARGIWLKRKPAGGEPRQIDINDAEAVKAMFAGLSAKRET